MCLLLKKVIGHFLFLEPAVLISVRGVYLIKVCYDLVEKTEALQSFLIDIRLGIKLFEVWDGGEHHTHRLV